MILYHGSYLEIAVPDLVHSRANVDFGRGFYVTPLYEQAVKWCGKFKRRGKAVSYTHLDVYKRQDFIKPFGMSILDFFDFLTNSVMMPLAALATCILVLRVVGVKKIAEEVEISSSFKRKKMYNFFLKYLAPVFLVIILLSSIANVMGWISL